MRKYFGPRDFYKGALMIALPVMAQNLIQNLVSLIDNFMVSGLGDVKMSGVTVSGQILFIFMVVLSAICAAGGIFLTQYCGADDREGMQQALRFKAVTGGAIVIVYMVICMVFPRQAVSIMVRGNTQAEPILDQAEQYMFIMGLAGIPMLISNVIASSLRETGQVRAPLVISVAATCVNTLFNWILIYGNLGAPALEVRGAAIATVIARCVEAVLFCWYLYRERPAFLCRLSTILRIDRRLYFNILKRGGMLMASDAAWVFSETVTTALYNGRGGADVVSGMASGYSIANLFFVALGGIYTAAGVIMGKTLGRGELDEARRQKNWLYGASVLLGFAVTAVGLSTILLVPLVFGGLSAEAQGICREMVLIMALFMSIWTLNNTQFAISRSGGDTMMGMVVDGGGSLLTVAIIFLLVRITPWGPVELFLAMKVMDLAKFAVAFWWVEKEKWVRNLTEIM